MKTKYLKPDKTGKGWYQGYLKTKRWKRKVKNLIKERGGKVCVVCYTRKEVHTHHMTYKRITKEKPRDLVFLCKEHHFTLHERTKNKALSMTEALTDLKIEHQRKVFEASQGDVSYSEEIEQQDEHIRSLAHTY